MRQFWVAKKIAQTSRKFHSRRDRVSVSSEMETMTPLRWYSEGRAFLLIGLLFLASAISLRGYQVWQARVLSFVQPPAPSDSVNENDFPVRVLIPKFKIDLVVIPAKVSNDQWEIAEDSASYLLGSGVPGKAGNTVIYGHNKNWLFGPIRWMEKGDEIRVVNRKAEEFVYSVTETKKVSPQSVEVLAPTEDVTLTLYTCTGLLDRERFIVSAKLNPD